MKNLGFFIFFLFLVLRFSPVQAEISDLPEVPQGKALSFSLNTEFYQTSANYTNLGEFSDLDEVESGFFFRYISFRPKLTYFPLRWFSINAQVEGLWVTSASKDFERSLLRPNFYSAGFAVHSRTGPLTFSSGLMGGGSLSGFQDNDEIVIGCNCYFVEPNLWVIYDIKSLVYLFYNTSFRYRTFQLSSLWFHKAGGYIQTRRMNFGFSTDFFFSVISDFYKNQPDKRTSILKKVNAGSYRFYGVNPSALSFTTWIEWKVKPLFVSLYGNVDINGRSYSRGFTLGVNTKLIFSLESGSIDYRDYQHLKRKSRREKPFEEDSESEEESEYFEEEPGPKYEEEPKYKREPKSFKKKRAKRKRKKREKDSSSLSQELRKEIYNLRN